MGIQFVDFPEDRLSLLPLTYTRPLSQIRIGIFTIAEKWQKRLLIERIGYASANYLQGKFPPLSPTKHTLWIRGGLLPSSALVDAINSLEPHQSLYYQNQFLASRGTSWEQFSQIRFEQEISLISRPWHIFQKNGAEIRRDLELIPTSSFITLSDPHTRCYGDAIFIEAGAKVKAAILNAENGPIYIGKNAEVQEGSAIRGPFALCEGAVVNMCGKMRGDTTIGPFSKVGGEVSNSVIFGYSNKAHDGFLGNAVIGEWCNLGADSNNSNLKNNYGEVSLWDYSEEKAMPTSLQFCGLIMGDHAKCGINTMFNTGTSVGVAANVFGGGFPPTFLPSFSWGGASGLKTHRLAEAIATATQVMNRRGVSLSQEDSAILKHIFMETSKFRTDL